MDPNLQNIILTIVGFLISGLVGLVGAILVFRGGLPGMAREAFEMSQKALKENGDLRDELSSLRAILEGDMLLTAKFSMTSLIKNGYAVLENGRIELIKEPVKEQT